ncbi:GxxExxY protein [Geomonas sp. RF6]|uniref:GxxExxY protein n=1 Tax=Geomonas sp. RF6 TaxID=2897342 RepID=UPI001E39C766|nr:GxxExxY protein [Geomonas sp. RF6]UFS72711.1 GxxExxY protein [Geomonas sp. RF6]
MDTDMDIEEIGRIILGCAIKVHSILGPGLLESVYQKCLAYELEQHGLTVQCEMLLPIKYGPLCIEDAYRIDMLVAGRVVVEHKAVEKILPIHEAQLLTYLKMNESKLGFILNWHVPYMKEGIRRMVNNL